MGELSVEVEEKIAPPTYPSSRPRKCGRTPLGNGGRRLDSEGS